MQADTALTASLVFWSVVAIAYVWGLVIVVALARRAASNVVGWILATLVFGPLALAASLALPARERCGMCDEPVRRGATRCPNCGWFERDRGKDSG